MFVFKSLIVVKHIQHKIYCLNHFKVSSVFTLLGNPSPDPFPISKLKLGTR